MATGRDSSDRRPLGSNTAGGGGQMKRKPNRFPVKRLFIFGAGASHCASYAPGSLAHKQAPLDKDLCNRIYDLDVMKPSWVQDALEYVWSGWQDPNPMYEYGLEEAITLQLTHLEFIDAIHPRRRKESVQALEYLNNLVNVLQFHQLQSCLRYNR